jgi:hypothetical protein
VDRIDPVRLLIGLSEGLEPLVRIPAVPGSFMVAIIAPTGLYYVIDTKGSMPGLSVAFWTRSVRTGSARKEEEQAFCELLPLQGRTVRAR